jgi:hypothetical protein
MAARIPTVVHNGTTTIFHNTVAPTVDHITGNITGFGSYILENNTSLYFMNGVGQGQTIDIKGSWNTSELVIHDPADFHGHVILDYAQPNGPFLKSPSGDFMREYRAF